MGRWCVARAMLLVVPFVHSLFLKSQKRDWKLIGLFWLWLHNGMNHFSFRFAHSNLFRTFVFSFIHSEFCLLTGQERSKRKINARWKNKQWSKAKQSEIKNQIKCVALLRVNVCIHRKKVPRIWIEWHSEKWIWP